MTGFRHHIKQLLNFSAREQLAIVAIVLMMAVVLSINLFPGLYVKQQQWDFSSFDSLVEEFYAKAIVEDKKPLRTTEFNAANPDVSAAEIKFNLFPFNPNMMPEEEWRRLGMAEHQIRMIKNYERSGGRFLRKEDLRKIYSVTDAEYKILEPYIVIPPVDQPLMAAALDTANVREPVARAREIPVLEINLADIDELMQLPLIGQWFAQRIIQYRSSLGGFVSLDQLAEVHLMDSTRLVAFMPYLRLDTVRLNLLNINRAEFSELLGHPYISFELTRLIVNHRERRGMIQSWDGLMQLPGADTLLNERLKPYLDFN